MKAFLAWLQQTSEEETKGVSSPAGRKEEETGGSSFTVGSCSGSSGSSSDVARRSGSGQLDRTIESPETTSVSNTICEAEDSGRIKVDDQTSWRTGD